MKGWKLLVTYCIIAVVALALILGAHVVSAWIVAKVLKAVW